MERDNLTFQVTFVITQILAVILLLVIVIKMYTKDGSAASSIFLNTSQNTVEIQ